MCHRPACLCTLAFDICVLIIVFVCPYATHWRDGTQEDEQIDNKQRIVVLATWLITYFFIECKLYALQLLKEVTRLAARYVYDTFEFSTKREMVIQWGSFTIYCTLCFTLR